MDSNLVMTAYYSGSSDSTAGSIISIVVGLIMIISMIGIFTKAGKPGWAAIIPFYNSWVLGEIVYGKGNGWKGFLVFIPVVGFIPGIMFLVRIAQVFGFGLLVALLNVLCGIVVLPIIALTGDYQGPVDSFI